MIQLTRTIVDLGPELARMDRAIAALEMLQAETETIVPGKRRRGRPRKIHAIEEPERAMQAGA